jgi:hypothetical protein
LQATGCRGCFSWPVCLQIRQPAIGQRDPSLVSDCDPIYGVHPAGFQAFYESVDIRTGTLNQQQHGDRRLVIHQGFFFISMNW